MRLRFTWVLALFALASRASAECPATWVLVSTAPFSPGTYSNLLMAYDSTRNVLVAITPGGGQVAEWNGHDWRSGFSSGTGVYRLECAAFDPSRGLVLALQLGTGLTWGWNGSRWSQLSVLTPHRDTTNVAFDAARSVAVLFGGEWGDVSFSDTWEMTGFNWSKVAIGSPPPRHYHAMVYDAARHQTLVFGGYLRDQFAVPPQQYPLNDLWAWNGSQWTDITPAGAKPDPRYHASMTYHARRGSAFVCCGSTPQNDTKLWEWDGSGWHSFPTTGLSNRLMAPMVYSDAEDCLYLLGGYDFNDWRGQLYRLVIPEAPQVLLDQTPRAVCIHKQLTLSVQASGPGSISFQWRHNGTAMQGTNDSMFTIDSANLTDAGLYDCVVDNGCGTATSAAVSVSVVPDLIPNGVVDTGDLTLLLLFFGLPVSNNAADFNGDGVVNTQDLTMLLLRFGQTCP